ncbi:anthranilate synthase component I [Virgibacillus halodenitrificans]|uniref:anthranilate synthase component I n=1 Tax=Virgibacillus halodenitrificans TaxID=1482 RepID=UPI001371985B|nr:anthranilate synthase component I [Virgibacillus halodenitrificans]MYL46815.1 anthranilate synthase component I [Virgibacillus halodenitrificans]
MKKIVTHKLVKLNADTLTPIRIFHQLSGQKKFLLESSVKHEQKGNYSFIGADPYEELIGMGNTSMIINHDSGKKSTVEQHVLDYLKESFHHIELDIPLPFYGGAVGYIGYDTIRTFEDIGEEKTDDLSMPDIHLMIYRNIFVFDHKEEVIYLIAINQDEQSEEVLLKRLNSMQETLQRNVPYQEEKTTTFSFQPEVSEESFKEKVRTAKHHILRGDIFQVVLSQRMKADMKGSPFQFYRQLRKANPSPYMFYIDFDEYLVLGASPESLIQTSGKTILTNPIAGTRPRGETKEKDEQLIQDLLSDEKEIAEHRMLVDLSRNDLGSVCEIGSITIPTYMQIEKYQHVMHIVSEVKGRLKVNCSSIDALISCLPAGTVSGAPKIRAMQIINDLEEKKRGVYAGGIGYINFNNDLNIALAIRSLVVKDNQAYLQAGAGIVHDSDPGKEFQETLHKAKSLMEVSQYDAVNR